METDSNQASACSAHPPVLLVGNFLSPAGGTPSVGEALVVQLKSLGYSVRVTSKKPGRVARLIDMVTTSWRQRSNYAVAQVDVFSGNAFIWAEIVSWVLRCARKPFILTLHGGNLPVFARRWPGRVRRILASAAVVTTPSTYLREQLSTFRSDIQVLPNALNLDAYEFHVRAQLCPRMIWLRAFHSIYNPTLPVRAQKILASDFPNVELTMIGPDKGDGSLQRSQQLARQLRIDSRVCFQGSVPKEAISEWLNKGDIFINSTDFESFGISVMEAAACGLCIVTTNVGELANLWQDGVDALLVPPDDPQAMAAAVRRILTEPGLAEQLSRNARRKAEQFDWSSILPEWERLFTLISSQGRRNV